MAVVVVDEDDDAVDAVDADDDADDDDLVVVGDDWWFVKEGVSDGVGAGVMFVADWDVGVAVVIAVVQVDLLPYQLFVDQLPKQVTVLHQLMDLGCL